MVAQMEDYGFFESQITRSLAPYNIQLRNIGWPADDVFGLARSQFGSAQNTRSWKPPNAEEGFGSKVLLQHISEADPTVLIIGYGSELAFENQALALDVFKSGYLSLVNFADSSGFQIILLTPPKQERVFSSQLITQARNQRLQEVQDFIVQVADEKNLICIDLYSHLIIDSDLHHYTTNGVHLNHVGHKRLGELIQAGLSLSNEDDIIINIDTTGQVVYAQGLEIDDLRATVRGYSFQMTAKILKGSGKIQYPEPFAIRVDGEVVAKGADSLKFDIPKDLTQIRDLNDCIATKNKLHRYRLRPMNEAYIYLFRRHEMGHLAYEMDDFAKLVAEEEEKIQRLLKPQTRHVEIELIKEWQPPRNYPEHEVPANIPIPNINKEIESFTLSEGLEISAFASDPMIANPIHLSWDTKGRAWVATSSTYPHIVPGLEPNDRIIILQDADYDGVAEKSTVFAEGLLVPHSVMPVPGGAYVTSTTEFLFLADTNGDDRADERITIYDGFGNADVHHMIHGLRWSPWGDLFFTQSIYINSFVETPHGPRKLNGSGIWRFRPERQSLDVFSRGLINPWGHAFDEWGQAFATDGAGSSGVNYVFPESAHATAVGAAKILDGLNSGTPKNTGLEVIYSQHLPSHWQGTMITNDFRANRTVRYRLDYRDGQYTSQEVETIAHSDHRSYRPVDVKIGPDGALYIVDWYNPIIDHGEVDFHHPVRDKTHGRIWRVSNKNREATRPHLFSQYSETALLNLLKSPDQFVRLQANRALVEKNCSPTLILSWIDQLERDASFEHHRLEGLWLLTALNHLNEELLLEMLRSKDARVRAAAVRVTAHWKWQKQTLQVLSELVNDSNAQVRLEVVTALRELGTKEAFPIMLDVLDSPMDDNLKFAAWLGAKEMQKIWLPEIENGNNHFLRELNKRMFALISCDNQRAVKEVAKLVKHSEIREELAIEGWKMMATHGDADVLQQVLDQATLHQNTDLLISLINAPNANASQPKMASENISKLISNSDEESRIAAIKLIDRWDMVEFKETLLTMVRDMKTTSSIRRAAFRALHQFGETGVIERSALKGDNHQIRIDATVVWAEKQPLAAASPAVSLLSDLTEGEDARDLFTTFRSSEKGPPALTDALAQTTLTESVAAMGLRVMQSSGFDLSALEQALRKAGSIEPVGTTMTAEVRQDLLKEANEIGDRYRGRNIYNRPHLLCATCHRINNIGGLIGPDLSTLGSYMSAESILESLLNPSRDIKQGYETVIVNRTSGELVSGTLHRKTDRATLIRMANNEIVTIPANEIEKIDVSPVSLMPAELTATLHRDELRDLVSYLISLGNEN